MSVRILGLDTHLPWWAAVPVFCVAWSGVIWLVWLLLRRWHAQLQERPGRRRMETLSNALRLPFLALVVLAGGKVLIDSDAFHEVSRRYANLVLGTLFAVDIVWAAIRIVAGGAEELVAARPHFAPLKGSINLIARAGFIVVGVLVWMQAVDIPIDTLLVIGGLIGLTLGLALQDTLRNFLAGLYIAIERPVRIGDFVTVEGGYEGVVIDIGWRSIRLRTHDNQMVVIANQRLSERVFVNHSLPQKWLASSFSIRVPAGADLAAVAEKVREEIRAAAGEVAGLRSDPEPRAASKVDAEGIEITATYTVGEPRDVEPVREALLRRVYDRLRTEGYVPSR